MDIEKLKASFIDFKQGNKSIESIEGYDLSCQSGCGISFCSIGCTSYPGCASGCTDGCSSGCSIGCEHQSCSDSCAQGCTSMMSQ